MVIIVLGILILSAIIVIVIGVLPIILKLLGFDKIAGIVFLMELFVIMLIESKDSIEEYFENKWQTFKKKK